MGAFHEGEQAVQERAGVREQLAHAAFLRDFMPQQHRDFFALLPFMLLASVDAQGQPWASALAGAPGFAHSPDDHTLQLEAWPAAHDPLAASLHPGAALGLLGIQQHTRRRNRMNGHVAEADGKRLRIRVDQSFGNCPKYIQAREARFDAGRAAAPQVTRMAALDANAQALVRSADTFFIATAHPQARDSEKREHGIDVSHRGGKPGFVRVDGGHLLTVPDFTGNSFFNTIGNLLLEPRCGLLFVDFATGDTLQLSATARLVEDGADLASFRGALRLLRFEVTGAIHARRALPLYWGEATPSPVLEHTGSWSGA
ncbi:MAG TPA: pyridoxamine 5'-phosphate oxidase family protein [Ramlibacter sp.]|nr:pyridoxamine 5'-phosphate oxidase family protein [Ramlibacter sp.]